MSSDFISRARSYAEWDRRLAAHTRFYAAAAATNSALAYLSHAPLRIFCISKSTLSFLSTAGCALESTNLAWAQSLVRSNRTCLNLDIRMIRSEQLLLERSLLDIRTKDSAGYSGLVKELDRMLGWLSRDLLPAGVNLELNAFSSVLRTVVRDLGRPVTFANYNDRVRIGCALILHIRSAEPKRRDLKQPTP